MALAADLAIAADDTVFNLAYARVGASLDAGSSWALPRIVGLRKAMELSLLADSVEAPEALRLGLVNRVVPRADLGRESDVLIQRLASGPTQAYGRIRQLLRQSSEHEHAAPPEHERLAFKRLTATEDFRAGIEAFFARRTPIFRGR